MFRRLVLFSLAVLFVGSLIFPGPIQAAEEPAVVCNDAEEPEGRRFFLGPRKRARIGATRWKVFRIVREIKETEGLPLNEDGSVDKQLLAEQVAQRVVGANLESCREVVGSGDERDWSAFFDALIAFLERLMPLILQLIEIFGGLSTLLGTAGHAIASIGLLGVPLVFCPRRRRAA